jgi:hypothetical protein
MMAEADGKFTSWADLRDRLRDDLASAAFRTMQSYTINASGSGGARTVTYRSLAELKHWLVWVEQMADIETGQTYAPRTYPKNKGRG